MTKMENIVKQIREGLVLDFMILNIYSLNIYIYIYTHTHTHTHTHFNDLSCTSVAMKLKDSILKSRDITLPTRVHLVKAMVFPVVMYGCESWTIKKAEHQRIDAFELWCWRRLLRVPWTARRSN